MNYGDAPEIPNKLFFRIGEVSSLLGVEPYVLRYWESEFSALSPKKSGSGHRLYKRKDVELLLRIKYLLYQKRFTIEGARQSLRTGDEMEPSPQPSKPSGDPLVEIRRELRDILQILS